WEERIGVALLIAGVAIVWWLGARLSLLQAVLAWSVLLVAAAVLLRPGWLQLFRPGLFYHMGRPARRRRPFLLRCPHPRPFLFLLFGGLGERMGFTRVDHYQAARLAEQFFETLMLVQLVAVTVLTPAYVAGAIAEEKDRKTMEFLLATDLRNREIVLSKLVARL